MKLLSKKQQKPTRRSGSFSKEGRVVNDNLAARYSFRRNRTLTGSLASGVGSASEHSSELKSSRVQVHHLRKHRRRLFGVLLAVTLVSGSFFWLIYQSIAGVNVSVNASVPPLETSMYQTKIQNYLNEHPLERSRMTLNTNNLAVYLQENGLPEVASVSVRPDPASLGVSTVVLTMRRAVISWKTGPTQLFVDSQGAAFKRNYYAPPTLEVVDLTGIQAVNNQVLASDRFLGFIGRIIGQLGQYDLIVSKVVLPESTTRQLLVSFENVPFPVKFSVDRLVGEQAEDAARAIRHLGNSGATVEYLDVRVSGRAYYK